MSAKLFRGAAELQYEGQAAPACPPGDHHCSLGFDFSETFCSRPPWWWRWTGRSSSRAPSPASARGAGQYSREFQLTRFTTEDIQLHGGGMYTMPLWGL